jgi:hypothetical protein
VEVKGKRWIMGVGIVFIMAQATAIPAQPSAPP